MSPKRRLKSFKARLKRILSDRDDRKQYASADTASSSSSRRNKSTSPSRFKKKGSSSSTSSVISSSLRRLPRTDELTSSSSSGKARGFRAKGNRRSRRRSTSSELSSGSQKRKFALKTVRQVRLAGIESRLSLPLRESSLVSPTSKLFASDASQGQRDSTSSRPGLLSPTSSNGTSSTAVPRYSFSLNDSSAPTSPAVRGRGRTDSNRSSGNLDDKPQSKTSSPKVKRVQSAFLDTEQGVWRCRNCNWIYPNPNPSARHRRDHKKHCGDILNVQHWLTDVQSGEQESQSRVGQDDEGGAPTGTTTVVVQGVGNQDPEVRDTEASLSMTIDQDIGEDEQLEHSEREQDIILDNVNGDVAEEHSAKQTDGNQSEPDIEAIGSSKLISETEGDSIEDVHESLNMSASAGDGEVADVRFDGQGVLSPDPSINGNEEFVQSSSSSNVSEDEGHSEVPGEEVPKENGDGYELRSGGESGDVLEPVEPVYVPDADVSSTDVDYSQLPEPEDEREERQEEKEGESGAGVPETGRDEADESLVVESSPDAEGDVEDHAALFINSTLDQSNGLRTSLSSSSSSDGEVSSADSDTDDMRRTSRTSESAGSGVVEIHRDNGVVDVSVPLILEMRNTITFGVQGDFVSVTEDRNHAVPVRVQDDVLVVTDERMSVPWRSRNAMQDELLESFEDERVASRDEKKVFTDSQIGNQTIIKVNPTNISITGITGPSNISSLPSKTGQGSEESSPECTRKLVDNWGKAVVEETSGLIEIEESNTEGLRRRVLKVESESEASSSNTHSVQEYDLERIIHDQTTHDIMCPVCGSCITKRVILRKRKRFVPVEGSKKLRLPLPPHSKQSIKRTGKVGRKRRDSTKRKKVLLVYKSYSRPFCGDQRKSRPNLVSRVSKYSTVIVISSSYHVDEVASQPRQPEPVLKPSAENENCFSYLRIFKRSSTPESVEGPPQSSLPLNPPRREIIVEFFKSFYLFFVDNHLDRPFCKLKFPFLVHRNPNTQVKQQGPVVDYKMETTIHQLYVRQDYDVPRARKPKPAKTIHIEIKRQPAEPAVPSRSRDFVPIENLLIQSSHLPEEPASQNEAVGSPRNCIDIVRPPFPWGPPLQESEESEVNCLDVILPTFPWGDAVQEPVIEDVVTSVEILPRAPPPAPHEEPVKKEAPKEKEQRQKTTRLVGHVVTEEVVVKGDGIEVIKEATHLETYFDNNNQIVNLEVVSGKPDTVDSGPSKRESAELAERIAAGVRLLDEEPPKRKDSTCWPFNLGAPKFYRPKVSYPEGPSTDSLTQPLLREPEIEPQPADQGGDTVLYVPDPIAVYAPEEPRTDRQILKSLVYGGLDTTLISLGVVSSATGGDASTLTVLGIGLANVMFGFIAFFGTISSLYKSDRARFQEVVGPSYKVNGFLALFAFLLFGLLPPVTYGFSFRHKTNRDWKMGATCVVALVSIILLGWAKARVTKQRAHIVISTLVTTGFVAAIASYKIGDYVTWLLKDLGFDSV